MGRCRFGVAALALVLAFACLADAGAAATPARSDRPPAGQRFGKPTPAFAWDDWLRYWYGERRALARLIERLAGARQGTAWVR